MADQKYIECCNKRLYMWGSLLIKLRWLYGGGWGVLDPVRDAHSCPLTVPQYATGTFSLRARPNICSQRAHFTLGAIQKHIKSYGAAPPRRARARTHTHINIIYIDVYTVRQVHAALPFEGWAGRPACSSVCARGWEQKRRSRTAPTTLRHYRSLRSNHWVRRDVYKCFAALNLYLENAALLSEFKSEF